MKELSVDVAIIGAGTAGLNARREAEKAGKSYVLIEEGAYGTTCARVGCMPSKLLIAASERAHSAHDAARFGIDIGNIAVDGKRVMERVRSERDRFVGFVVRATERVDESMRLIGHASFLSPNELVVGDHTRVKANAVVIATGSRPWVPPPFDSLDERVDFNDQLFDWEDLPKSVAVIGTGIIGLELGQALHRLGVRTTFFNPFDVVGPFTDPEVAKKAKTVLSAELDLRVGIEDVRAENIEGGVRIRWREGGEEKQATFERVLAAAGRRANIDRIDLDKAGVELDERGRPVRWDPLTCQLGDTSIYLAGDAANHRPLLHEASDEGHIAGFNASRHPEVKAHERRTPLAIAFTEPQMALVGKRFADIDGDLSVAIGEVSYDDQGRARVMGMNSGLVRLYATRDRCELLGAELFAPRAEHLAQQLAFGIAQRLTVQQLLAMPFYHPVLEEGLRTGLRDVARKLKMIGGCRTQDLERCPGS